MCFNSLKACLKRALSVHGPITASEGQTLVGARRQFLLNCYPDALGPITAATTLNSFFHVLTVTIRKALHSKIYNLMEYSTFSICYLYYVPKYTR